MGLGNAGGGWVGGWEMKMETKMIVGNLLKVVKNRRKIKRNKFDSLQWSFFSSDPTASSFNSGLSGDIYYDEGFFAATAHENPPEEVLVKQFKSTSNNSLVENGSLNINEFSVESVHSHNSSEIDPLIHQIRVDNVSDAAINNTKEKEGYQDQDTFIGDQPTMPELTAEENYPKVIDEQKDNVNGK